MDLQEYRRRLWIAAIALVVAVSTVSADRVPADIAKGRDLNSYENGGVYRTPPTQHELTDIQRLREFVLTHWRQKRRGYVEFVFQDIDAGSDHYFFIEPVGDHWRIAWVEQGYSVLPGYSPPPPEFHRDIVTVERCRGSLIFFDAKDRVVTFL